MLCNVSSLIFNQGHEIWKTRNVLFREVYFRSYVFVLKSPFFSLTFFFWLKITVGVSQNLIGKIIMLKWQQSLLCLVVVANFSTAEFQCWLYHFPNLHLKKYKSLLSFSNEMGLKNVSLLDYQHWEIPKKKKKNSASIHIFHFFWCSYSVAVFNLFANVRKCMSEDSNLSHISSFSYTAVWFKSMPERYFKVLCILWSNDVSCQGPTNIKEVK